MSLRIIAGEWRGRLLVVPGGDSVRPTAARAREALFSMLQSRVGGFDGLRVLDLFAGSGALGLEALSRGAAHACFVEQFPAPLAALRRNIAALGCESRSHVLARPVETLGPAAEAFDVAFLDPPYHMGLARTALDRLVSGGWLGSGAWIAVETAKDDELPGWIPDAQRDHGKARLRLLRSDRGIPGK